MNDDDQRPREDDEDFHAEGEGEAEGFEPEGEEAPPRQHRAEQVPQQALHVEREANKTLRRQLDTLNQRFGDLQSLVLQQAQAQQQQQRPEPEPEPEQPPASFDEDPSAFLHWRTEQLAKRLDQRLQPFENHFAEQRQSQERAQREQQAMQAINQAQMAFAQQHPDYFQAVQHLTRAQIEEQMALGLDPQQAQNMVAQNQIMAAVMALSRGDDPAEGAYKAAQARGFRSQAAQQQQGDEPNQMEEDMRTFERRQAGQREARSMSGTRGGRVPTRLTSAQLAEMSQADYERLRNSFQQKNPGAGFLQFLSQYGS